MKSKEEKGITLVVLVITVITTLILAGVGVSLIKGENGLFSSANSAATKYNGVSQEEAERLARLTNYLNGGGLGSTEENIDETDKTNIELDESDGTFDNIAKVNAPDLRGFDTDTIKYLIWNESNGTYTEDATNEKPLNWFDYNNGQWANIKTTSTATDENGNPTLQAYWVWVPRFAYKLPESSSAKEIEVIFVKNTSKKGVLEDGTEVDCYYPTDTQITTEIEGTGKGSGLYKDATNFAKGKDANGNAIEQAWIIPPAFTFGDTQLNGIWVAKFEPSSKNGEIQIVENETSWKSVLLATVFTKCLELKNNGHVLGSLPNNSTLDSHTMKNTEWGAIAILSQSKYGIYNPISKTGENGDKTYQVWNNPNNNYKTGMASKNDNGYSLGSQADTNCDRYNTGYGPKASTTGTVYGIYDMAGGAWENMASAYYDAIQGLFGSADAKYYDVYYTSPYSFIGDMTAELLPGSATWNSDASNYVSSSYRIYTRGGRHGNTSAAGILAFSRENKSDQNYSTFRPVLVIE